MAEHVVRGLPASPGQALGRARVLRVPEPRASTSPIPAGARAAERARAAAALEAAAVELERLAARLEALGRRDEADIVSASALMARDPGLAAATDAAVADHGRPAPAAVLEAAAAYADTIAALPDEHLAARAQDVRSLGRRAARLAAEPAGHPAPAGAAGGAGRPAAPPGRDPGRPSVPLDGAAPGADDGGGAIVVAGDLGPADVAELGAGVLGVVLAAGGPTAHAAIVARSLGIPMAVGLGPAILAAADGDPVVVDGTEGTATLAPDAARVKGARAATAGRERARARARADRDLPAATRDGRRVRVLVNAAGAAEVEAGLAAGAEGAGLIRTELGFLDATDWPDEAAHRRALRPVLSRLAGRTATVRVLDFGADKTPPFLRGTRRRGIGLLLAHEGALTEQLAAIAAEAGKAGVRVLLPMVEDPEQLEAVAALMARSAPGGRRERLPLGPMVETPEAASAAFGLAERAAFLSIGTNDLTHAALGSDRFAPGETHAHHPVVLGMVDRCAQAARGAGIPLEVCGEAASDPLMVPLLVGLGVDELSVGAARVGAVRGWVRDLDAGAAQRLARRALEAPDAQAVAVLAGPAAERLASLLEGGDAGHERVDGSAGVVAVGLQP